jgi:hypothetical protein
MVKKQDDKALLDKSAQKLLRIIKTPTRSTTTKPLFCDAEKENQYERELFSQPKMNRNQIIDELRCQSPLILR